jgi:hypothetical protein
MDDERLTDLALLSVHYGNVSVSPEQGCNGERAQEACSLVVFDAMPSKH